MKIRKGKRFISLPKLKVGWYEIRNVYLTRDDGCDVGLIGYFAGNFFKTPATEGVPVKYCFYNNKIYLDPYPNKAMNIVIRVVKMESLTL